MGSVSAHPDALRVQRYFLEEVDAFRVARASLEASDALKPAAHAILWACSLDELLTRQSRV